MRHAILTIAVLLLSSLASIHAGEQTLDAQTGISKTAKIELENGFRNPPDSVRPRTWWHWREGRISKEGITAELEAMKRIGVGGVTMFSASRYGETGPKILCLSPEWHERVRFAMQEAERLGLTFNFQNCAGWSGEARCSNSKRPRRGRAPAPAFIATSPFWLFQRRWRIGKPKRYPTPP